MTTVENSLELFYSTTTPLIYIYLYIHTGCYPVYSGRPPVVVDWELNKREAVLARHKEINGNSLLLVQLRSKVFLICTVTSVFYILICTSTSSSLINVTYINIMSLYDK